jgi:hypothetical protein
MQAIAKDECLISEAADSGIGPYNVNASIIADKLACCARSKRHGSFHAQPYSDVIDVVDTRSFEVKERNNFLTSAGRALRRTKHARSIDAR